MNIGVVMYQTSFTRGQELVAQRMTHELVRQGHKAFLITGPFHDEKPVAKIKELIRSDKGYLFFGKSEFQVPLIRVDGYISNWPRRRVMFRDFLSIMRNLVDSFQLDFIIGHSTLWNGPEEIAKLIAWKKMLNDQGLDEKRVIYAHMPHYQPPDPLNYNVIERTYRTTWNTMIFPQIFNTAKLILCTTPIEMDQMVALAAGRTNCHLYPGGIDVEPFQRYWSNDPSSFLEKYSIPKEARIVTYLGTLEERKNPLAIVRVAKILRKLENVHFVIAGRPFNQYEIVKKESEGLRNLSYIGEVSEEEKIMLIKSSYINVLMSHIEALGITQLEFMYGGVPIITSAVGGQKWVVRNRVDGIHVNGSHDLEGLKEAIITLVQNPELCDQFGVSAKDRAKEFTLNKIVSDLTSRLASLTNS